MDNAEKFIELLEAGKIKKNILHNCATDYSVAQEKEDLENYRFFANSFTLDEIINCEVALYNGSEQI